MNLTQLVEELKGLVSRVPDPTAQITERDERIAELTEELETKSNAVVAAQAAFTHAVTERDTAVAEVATIKETHAKALADLEESVKTKAAAMALEITAGQGQPPVGQGEDSGSTLLEQYNAASPAERTRLYRKHGKALSRAALK
jgi:chromosome segregation ATPase